ncbi:MAG TPA: hypothetical protein DHW02_23340 [Ktedonobacter sp.]|nr:hypothetical protein [Ktedonobacter sp.]
MQGDDRAFVTLRLPATLSTFSSGKGQIALRADTIKELLAEVKQQYPQLWERLCDEQGSLRPDVKMFVDNEVITGYQDMELTSGQEVIVLPAITPRS